MALAQPVEEPTPEPPKKKRGNKPGSDPVGLQGQHETLLTDKVQQGICAALGNHMSMRTAAALNGVSTNLVYVWLRRGAEDDSDEPYRSFNVAVKRAIAMSEGRLVKQLGEAADDGDVKVTQFLLERRHREEWGRTDTVEHQVTGGKPIEIQLVWPGQGVIDPQSELALPAALLDNPEVVDAEVIEEDDAPASD